MRRFLLSLAVLAALAAALAAAALAPPASGQALSPGCALLNGPNADGFYVAGTLGDTQFAAGEHVTMTAGLPADGPPTQVRLFVDVLVDSTAFPGTVEYTFPAAGTHSLAWLVFGGGSATWTVSCTPAPFDPEQAITDLRNLVAGMGLPKGVTTALNAKLNAALKGLDTDSACGPLQAFLNQVNAQAGKKLSSAQAGELTDSANHIRDQLDC